MTGEAKTLNPVSPRERRAWTLRPADMSSGSSVSDEAASAHARLVAGVQAILVAHGTGDHGVYVARRG